MPTTATTPDEYIASLPEDRRKAMSAIRDAVNKNLPKGFKECIAYGMIGWVVPLETYPAGYHCNPKLPLGFMNLASQKNYISLHSLCLYGSTEHLAWFEKEWPKHSTRKLDMGKGCIRFKNMDDIPLDLIVQLARRVTPKRWIETYEMALGTRKGYRETASDE